MNGRVAEKRGWRRYPADPAIARWAATALVAAEDILGDAAQRATWLRHGDTWFVGVDALHSHSDGSIGGVPLEGDVIADLAPLPALHRAQLSVVYPGYPGRDRQESEAAHRFRCDRDAAHLDGLLPVGPARRRFLRECHAFVLGLPLDPVIAGASPLVVWEGSHGIMREMLRQALDGIDPAGWAEVDLTHTYQAARNTCFERCARVEIAAQPGEAVLVHRFALHGVAPWSGQPEGRRANAYFRPLVDPSPAWLADP